MILLASLSNLIFKMGVIGSVGGLPLSKKVAPFFAVSIAVGISILLLG